MSKNSKAIKRLINFSISIALLLFSGICLLKISGAFIMYHYEQSCAYELYRMESLSPIGPSESFEEMQEHILDEFSNSWENRLVSGTTDVVTSLLLVFSLLALFVISLCILINFVNRFKNKQKKT